MKMDSTVRYLGVDIEKALSLSGGIDLCGPYNMQKSGQASLLAVNDAWQDQIAGLAVVLISIVGPLVTDNLVDNFGVSLITTAILFTGALAATFAVWFASERTLSIHAIFTTKRETFYWLAILFTFALGMAAGDLVAEAFGLGYLATGVLLGMIIASLTLGYFFLGLDPILGFWLAYIFTRPLGASFGDLLSQPIQYGGFGLGTIISSALFLGTIMAIVAWISFSRRGEECAILG